MKIKKIVHAGYSSCMFHAKSISLILLILFLLIPGCSTFSKMNLQLANSQYSSIKRSPFESALGFEKEIRQQLNMREAHYPEVIDSILNSSNDTLIFIESYELMCINCPANYVQLCQDSIVLNFTYDYSSESYLKTIDTIGISDGYFVDIVQLMQDVRDNPDWYKSPERYSSDNVLDGGQSIYSVIYPDKSIKSIYVRSWIRDLDF